MSHPSTPFAGPAGPSTSPYRPAPPGPPHITPPVFVPFGPLGGGPGGAQSGPAPLGPRPDGPGRASGSRRGPALALGLLVGVLVCAIAATALWFTGVLSWGSAPATSPAAPVLDSRPVTLPDTIGDLRQEVLVLADQGSAAQRVRDGVAEQTDRTAAALTATYGAGAGAAAYSEDDLDAVVWAMAVRAAVAPPVVLPAGPTADELGLSAVPREVLSVGDVRCVVQNDPVPAGQDVTPIDRHVLSCQRGDATRTVITTFTAQPTIEYAARFTDEVWNATAGA